MKSVNARTAIVFGVVSFLLATKTFSQSLEEVVVKARYRSESLQDVPVAVTALSGDFVASNNVQNLLDVEKYVPNVEFTIMPFAGQALSASIRGLAFDDLEKSFEPTVGVAIDGMFMGTSAGANVDFFDVASVEILRGPQGTLFGRNTIGGLVNIRRTRPTGEFGVKALADVGRYRHLDLKALVNIPLIEDRLAAKVSLRQLQNDTFQRNVTRDENVDGRDLVSGNLALLFTPNDSIDALLTIDWYDDESHPPELLNVSTDSPLDPDLFCAGLAAIAVPPNPLGCASASADISKRDNYTRSFSPIPFRSFIDGVNAIAEVNWDIGDYKLTSVTALQDFDELLDEENTGSPINIFRATRPGAYEQFSQEFRVESQWDGSANFVAGVFYFTSDYALDNSAFVFGNISQAFSHHQELNAYSVFGEGTYDVTQSLRLTLGGRYTAEEKSPDHKSSIQAGGPYTFRGSEDWSEFTPRVGLDYSWDDDKMLYVTYSTGFRSGGFTGRPTTLIEASTAFNPETVDNYEVGIRSEWLNNRLRTNLTGFYMTIDDKQETIVVPSGATTSTFVVNAGSAEYQGFEFEGALTPFADHDLSLRAAAGYLDASYSELINNGVDVSKNALVIYAPEWTLSVGGDYARNLGGGELVYNWNYKWTDDSFGRTSDFAADPLGRHIIESFGALDMSLTYRFRAGDATLTLSAYGQDLLQEGARLGRPFDTGGVFYFNTPVIRRNYGIQFGVEF